MATLNQTGLETGDASEFAATAGTFSVVTSPTAGAWSAYSVRVNPTATGTGSLFLRGVSAAGAATLMAATTLYARFRFRYDTKPSSGDEILYFVSKSTTSSATNRKMEVRLNSSGNLVAYDSAGTVMGTGATALSAGTWYLIEAQSGNGTSVAWEVKLNGVSEISGTGNLQAATNQTVILGKCNDSNGKTVDFFYDDILLSDSAYPGDGRNTLLLPNANGNYQTATIGAGGAVAHYTVADEVPNNGDTDYLLTDSTSGHAETEAMTDTATVGISGTINSAKALCVLKRDGASNGSIKQRRRSASTDSDLGSAFASTSAYTLCASLLDTDPATSSAWTTGGIDGVEVGVVEQSVSNKTRMTFCGLCVDWTPGGGATNYTQSLTGTVTPSATIAKADAKPLADTCTPSAALAKLDSKLLVGTSTPSGATVVKLNSKALTGSEAPSTSLAKTDAKGLTGTATPSSTTAKATGKPLAGVTVPAGSILKAISKALSGATSLARSLTSAILRGLTLSGTVTPSGAAVSKDTSKSLTTSVTPSPVLMKDVSQSRSGSVSLAGAIAKAVGKALSSLVSLLGSLTASSRPIVTPPKVLDAIVLRRTQADSVYLKRTVSDTIVLRRTVTNTTVLGD